MASKKKTEEEVAAIESRFSKQALMDAIKFSGRKDLLAAVLDENETYTISEVESLLDTFYKKEV